MEVHLAGSVLTACEAWGTLSGAHHLTPQLCWCSSVIPEMTPNQEAWKSAQELQIGTESYAVVFNPPTVDRVSCLMALATYRLIMLAAHATMAFRLGSVWCAD